jgi:hypothetical protein
MNGFGRTRYVDLQGGSLGYGENPSYAMLKAWWTITHAWANNPSIWFEVELW